MPKVSAARKVQKASKYDVTYARPKGERARRARRRLQALESVGLRRQ
jgi:hypothetical protein